MFLDIYHGSTTVYSEVSCITMSFMSLKTCYLDLFVFPSDWFLRSFSIWYRCGTASAPERHQTRETMHLFFNYSSEHCSRNSSSDPDQQILLGCLSERSVPLPPVISVSRRRVISTLFLSYFADSTTTSHRICPKSLRDGSIWRWRGTADVLQTGRMNLNPKWRCSSETALKDLRETLVLMLTGQ